MPDTTKPTPGQQAEAAYRHGQRHAPAVPLHVYPEKGSIPGVPMRGSGPGGDFTAEETHTRLTHADYEAGLKAGLLGHVASSQATPAAAPPRPRRKKSIAPTPAPVVAPAPAPVAKDGDL